MPGATCEKGELDLDPSGMFYLRREAERQDGLHDYIVSGWLAGPTLQIHENTTQIVNAQYTMLLK